MKLRKYQQDAHDLVISHISKNLDPCLIEAATGAGKSILISEIADTLHSKSGGKSVLCIAPSAKLVTQNREKFLHTGKPASIFSASAGSKCLRHPVVFCTPMTLLNYIDKIFNSVCAVVLDEAHKITPTIFKIVDALRLKNPNVRIIGLTATPYRRGEGFIYSINPDGTLLPEDQIASPYFKKLVYKITKFELEGMGFLTPAKIVNTAAENYDLSGLPRKEASEENLNAVYLGQGRQTARICAELVDKCRDRTSVMIFAATVRHAQEIAASLPTDQTRVIGGKINMEINQRKKVENDFDAGLYKYLVSVGTMTTGVDFQDVDAIAILRRTESLNLLEQIIGRGSRLPKRGNKTDFLLFDYADNLAFHYGEDVNLYTPEVTATFKGSDVEYVNSMCTSCGEVNKFIARPNPDRLQYDDEGYFLDLTGERIKTEHGPVPGHFGRRCCNLLNVGGHYERCGHRWTDKKCLECGCSNDIAARYCAECKNELVNPNDKLVIEFKKYKRDVTKVQCDNVLNIKDGPSMTKTGAACVVVNVTTEHRKFSFWLFPNSKNNWLEAKWLDYAAAKREGIKTITYRKDPKSGFFEAHDYNKPADFCEVV